jgi:hypothetical protein
MNSGFSNLATLKANLLGEALRASTEFNDVILALGLGVAGVIERHCHRRFARAIGTTDILPADRIQFLLPRFPAEAVTVIDVKRSEAEGWIAQSVTEFAKTIDLRSGIVYREDGPDAGEYSTQVRFTYTGGFFWEQLEPTDVGYPTAQPAGSTPLPHDLKLAWLLQCQDAWRRRDTLGADIAQSGNFHSALEDAQGKAIAAARPGAPLCPPHAGLLC